jgi:hypothetical protein
MSKVSRKRLVSAMEGPPKPPRVPTTGVMFATPSLNHQVSLEYLRSTVETVGLLLACGVRFAFKQVGGDPFIDKARNGLVTEFLTDHPDYSDFFFLDDDIGWPAGKVLEFLWREEDIVAGVYPQKSEKTSYPADLKLEDGCIVERNGLVKAAMAPTGFMRIKRHVLEKMAATCEQYWEPVLNVPEGRTRYAMFRAGFREGVGWQGEDYAFCRDWIDLGGEIWVDPTIPFTHRGHRLWRGIFLDEIKAVIQRFAEAAE